MYIRDVMTKNRAPISTEPETLVSLAMEFMVGNDIGSLVVMKGGEMVGFITERDIIRSVSKSGCAVLEAPVAEIMTLEPIIGGLDDSIDYARDVMTRYRVSHIPVMDGNTLVGVISFYDVAKACLREAKFENNLLKRYIKHWPE